MEPLISVIVPVYGVESYLRKCVDSILNQTYRNLEVILVDDGSPDNCGVICDAYSEQDSRVKALHKQNGGLSSARNAGMAVASGEFWCFVDSDDILAHDALEHMAGLAEKERADLVIGNHMRFEDAPPTPQEDSTTVTLRGKVEAMEEFFQNGCAAWARLYRREIHEGIEFPVGEINEDEAIVLSLLEKCERIVNTTDIVYYYRYRPESITTAGFHTKKLAWVRHCRDNLRYIESSHPELVPYAAARYRGSLLWALREIALSDAVFEREVPMLLKELRDNAGLMWRAPFAFWQDRVRLLLLQYGPFGLYRWLLRMRRKIH